MADSSFFPNTSGSLSLPSSMLGGQSYGIDDGSGRQTVSPFSSFGSGNEMLAASLHGIISDNTAVIQATQDVLKDLKDSIRRMTDMLGTSAVDQMAKGESPYGKGMPVYITNLGDFQMPGGHVPSSSAIPVARKSRGEMLAEGVDTYGGKTMQPAGVGRRRSENLEADAARGLSLSQGMKIGRSVGAGKNGVSLTQLAGYINKRMGSIGEDASSSQQFFGSAVGALAQGQGVVSSLHQGVSSLFNSSSTPSAPSAPADAGISPLPGLSSIPDQAGASPGEISATQPPSSMLPSAGAEAGAGAAEAAAGAGGLLDAIPGVGEIAMGITAAFGLFEGIGGAIADMRAQGAQYQSIYGGTEWGGLGQQALQQGFALSQTGTLTNSAADKLFTGVSQTGLQGGQRQNALNFAVGNFTNLGMNPQDSLAYIQQAAQDTSINLQTVANALTSVTNAAAAAGVNANVARASFLGMYTDALQITGGNSAAVTAAGATNYFSNMGRGMAGASIDYSSMSNQSRAAAALGYGSLGAYEAAIATNPSLAARGQQAIFNQVGAGNPAAQAIMAAQQGGRGANGEYGAIHPNSTLGQSLMRATPGGISQMKAQLQTAGVNIPNGADESAILGLYANMESGKGGGLVGATSQAQLKMAQANSRSMAKNQNQWFLAHGGTVNTSTVGYADDPNPQVVHQADTSTPLGHLLEMDRQRQLKYGQTQHFNVSGHTYTISQLEQHKAALKEAEAGHFGWGKPGPEAAVSKSAGHGAKGSAKVTIGLALNAQNILTVMGLQNSADIQLQAPVGNPMIPGGG